MTTPILGPSTISPEIAATWARSKNCKLTGVLLAHKFWEICPRLGVRPEVAYAQSMKETGYYYRVTSSTSVLNESFHNPCGLKTYEGGSNSDPNAHWRPDDWDIGILGQTEHLAKYAGAWILFDYGEPVDPRYDHVTWGSAPNVEDLSGKWAGKGYGQSIVSGYLTPLLQFAEEAA